jgi:hypothetical protein
MTSYTNFKSWLQEANKRPANRAAALWFYLAVGYLTFLVLPIGQWVGLAWEYRLFVTLHSVLLYTGFRSLHSLHDAGDLDAWESQFREDEVSN